MQNIKNIFAAIVIAAVVLLTISTANAQRQQIDAVAMGTSTQMGRVVSVKLIINEYSSDEDRMVLLQAFKERGSQGLTNAVSKMNSKGRISLTGTLGFDVNFIRNYPQPDGTTRIRFVTDRPITFGEAWSGTRSMDYSLSMGEIILSPDKKKSTGVIYPLSMLKLENGNELGLETYQNPWKLVNIRVSN